MLRVRSVLAVRAPIRTPCSPRCLVKTRTSCGALNAIAANESLDRHDVPVDGPSDVDSFDANERGPAANAGAGRVCAESLNVPSAA